MRKPLMAGNWKMYKTPADTTAFFEKFLPLVAASKHCDVLICPPFVNIAAALQAAKGSSVGVGGQNLYWSTKEGAFTGEVSGAMLKDVGCTYVLAGHSERRQYHAESDALVAKKFVAAQAAGLLPILCVGETLEERDGGTTQAVIARQLDAVIALAGIGAFARAVVAYEPVWAIGTGRTASPDQAQAVHAFIRDKLAALDGTIAGSLRILYGGSMKPSNAAELLGQRDVDGGLIGGASLVAADFLAICRAADR